MNVRIMNATLGNTSYLDKPGYIYEPKLDGYRALCYVDDSLTFMSRNNHDMTATYPELNFRKNIQARSAILDGEIVVYNRNGYPDFALLQQGYQASFVAFDILMRDGKSLIEQPLLERKSILASTVVDGDGIEKIYFTPHGHALWEEMKKRSMEGIVAKKASSLYYPGQRTNAWIKIKLLTSIDCVIIGYLSGKRAIASLALGMYEDDGKLRYIGNVGTGFSEHTLDELAGKLVAQKAPLAVSNNDQVPKNLIWVRPQHVAQVRYHEITPYGILRAAVFIRLRDDKQPEECTLAQH